MQLILYYQMAFKQEKVSVWLHTYRILSTSKTTGTTTYTTTSTTTTTCILLYLYIAYYTCTYLHY